MLHEDASEGGSFYIHIFGGRACGRGCLPGDRLRSARDHCLVRFVWHFTILYTSVSSLPRIGNPSSRNHSVARPVGWYPMPALREAILIPMPEVAKGRPYRTR
jgi:hypothetical protein